ncbi:hypothetical protein J0H58_07345 [bacterium]|nr:hypothetical protein [bacterium]
MSSTSAPTRRRKTPAVMPPILLSQPEAWAFVGLSRSAWFTEKAAGNIPNPVCVRTSPRPRWRRADLEAWVATLPTSHREAAGAVG